MNKFLLNLRLLVILGPILMTSHAETLSLPVPARGFVSLKQATIWEEGLICGNGTIGMNALSRPQAERIIFTHERLFMPMGDPVVPPDQSSHLPEIRKLIEDGKYKEAANLQFKLSGQKSFMYPDFFVPAFDLTILGTTQGEVSDYARSVDFQTAEAVVHWADDRGTFERRMFVSRKDGVAVIKLTASKPGSLSCKLKLEPRGPSSTYNDDSDIAKESDQMFKEHFGDIKSTATKDSLTFSARFLKAYPRSNKAVEGRARVVATGGSAVVSADGTLSIEGADSALLFVDIRLLKDAAKSEQDSLKTKLDAISTNYDALLKSHAALHGALFNRVKLDLGGGADHQKPTEKLMEENTFENINRAWLEKQFDAGRYNIICATGELPPNLQGVWGGNYVPGWASDYTHNGNVPSAIAADLMGNMPELMLPYINYIESLVPDLELNAKHLFGCRGIVLPSRTSTHGFNNAIAPSFAGGMWVAGAPWAAHYFYDYYLYTGDEKFLAERALPFMEKVALFFEDFVYEGQDGKYILSPATSPENTPSNTDSQATFNATMDVSAVKELLGDAIAASRKLGKNADKIAKWEKMLGKMPDYAIAKNGIIKEWLTPKLENNDAHRHSSQLYALYDGLPDEIGNSPQLRSACIKSVEDKLERYWKNNERGFMSFGIVQLGQVSASLGHGEIVQHCLQHLANGFWLNNLASMHNRRALFNMDISGGQPSVIIKALADSFPGKVRLLPALPKAWSKGTIEGVLCRGAIVLNRLHWDDDKVEVEMTSVKAQDITLVLPREISDIKAEGATVASGANASERKLTLPAGQKVTFAISLK
ncbi:MAG: glycoside hydrolase N-terminal domain-containing protein [Verrucomicrobiota bacterium]